MEFIGKDEYNGWRNEEFQESYANSKKKSKGIPRTENTILEIKNSLSIKSKFGNIGKRIYELDDRLLEITQTE